MNAVAVALEEIHDERRSACDGLPRRTYIQSVAKHRREELIRRYPALKEVWEANEAYAQASQRRLEALRESGLGVRVLAEYGMPDGNPMDESKSALHRLIQKKNPSPELFQF